MALIEAVRSQPEADPQAGQSGKDNIHVDLLRWVRELEDRLYRIDLQDPSNRVPQSCYYVLLNDANNQNPTLGMRVFHEGRKIVAIEVITFDEQ
jgi:hypothetical protein